MSSGLKVQQSIYLHSIPSSPSEISCPPHAFLKCHDYSNIPPHSSPRSLQPSDRPTPIVNLWKRPVRSAQAPHILLKAPKLNKYLLLRNRKSSEATQPNSKPTTSAKATHAPPTAGPGSPSMTPNPSFTTTPYLGQPRP